MNKNIRRCNKCGADSNVIDSRVSAKGFIIRRRCCQDCGNKWSSAEIPYKVAVLLYEMMDQLEKGAEDDTGRTES